MAKLKLQRWIPLEEHEQEAVFAWAEMMEGRYPQLALLSASMNGILTDARFGAKLKRLGRKKGYPDIFLAMSKRAPDGNIIASGLFIELKRVEGGVVSKEQQDWHAKLIAQGYRVVVCKGARDAIKVIEEYLQ